MRIRQQFRDGPNPLDCRMIKVGGGPQPTDLLVPDLHGRFR